ncbi:MAG: aldo/keto reductase [Actinobacteria bacterium]|nr:aldo/keto reductase [Actinomycetota bacterium]
MNRRKFIRNSTSTAMAFAVADPLLRALFAYPVAEFKGDIPKRVLGKTGEKVTIIGLGGWTVGRIKDDKVALDVISKAFDVGINFFDTAHSYQDGRSEKLYGKGLKGRRNKIFLMSKSTKRTKEEAQKELDLTLKRLQTDHLDLWQFHSIKTKKDVDTIFAPGGAFETAANAKKEGKIRFIGITGHFDPHAHLQALKHHELLDTIQMPINLVDPHQLSFTKMVLPKALEHNLGIIAMKTIANGRILEHQVAPVRECLTYVWNLPVSVIVSGCDLPEHVVQNSETAKTFRKLTEKERKRILASTAKFNGPEVEYYKKKTAG